MWPVLGIRCTDLPWPEFFHSSDECLLVHVGRRWWFVHELEPNLDTKQHTARSDGPSDGNSLVAHEWASAHWGVIGRLHRSSDRLRTNYIFRMRRLHAGIDSLLLGLQTTFTPHGIELTPLDEA